MLFQIALVIFSLFAIYKTWRQYSLRKVSKYWLLVFAGLWLVVALVAISPQTTDILAAYVGVGRGADLLVYVSVVVLFYIVYRLMVREQQLSRELTDLVRELAIRDAKPPTTPTTSTVTTSPGPSLTGGEA